MPSRRTSFFVTASVGCVFFVAGCDCASDESGAVAPVTAPGAGSAPVEVRPIAQRCAIAAEAAAEVLGEHAALDVAEPLTACIGVADGAWMLAPVEVSSEELEGPDPYFPEEGETVSGRSTEITYRLTYLAPDGETYLDQREEQRAVGRDSYNQSRDSVVIEHAFDYDGDGNQELILTLRERVFEESDYRRVFITFRDGKIERYAPAADVHLCDLVDHDADGRKDIVSCADFFPAPWANNDGTVDGHPALLFHSLPDGTFSASDDVAASFARAACPEPPAVIIESGENEPERAVACARLWGETTRALYSRIAAELFYAPAGERELLGRSLRETAAIEAPLTLRPTGGPSWYCLCYRERDGGEERDATACRRTMAPCENLEERASQGQGNMVSLGEGCRHVGNAEHPRERVGQGAAWEASSRPGAWWVPGECVLR